ncbi:MAG: TonB C-terminal domain-containing protein [Acidimicrobiia bacterium]|nr:TonB C-terminal domain-containing protein [Acidimicrobiia bacterium]
MDAVSEVIVARAPKNDRLNSMLGASALAHVAMLTALVFLPAWWFGAEFEQPETIMTISLGGPIGPNDGGLSTLGGRTIQEAVPVDVKKPEPIRPPSAKVPEMVVPTKAPPKKTPPPKVEATDPRSARPTKGAEVQKGTSVAETGAKGMGFGLSSGGGGAGGHLEVSDFCCPEFLTTMASVIRSNWNHQVGATGRTHLRFVIQKDGRIVDITVERSSGYEAMDQFARRALLLSKLPPLPAAYGEPVLAVHLYFDYTR